MHIILGILTSIVTICYFLDRWGIDIGGLNPFYWARRRAWAKKYHGDPIYAVEDPLEVAALLVVGAAKLGGDLSAGQKEAAQKIFETRFSMDSRESAQLLTAAGHLLAAPQLLDSQLQGLAEKNKTTFSGEQGGIADRHDDRAGFHRRRTDRSPARVRQQPAIEFRNADPVRGHLGAVDRLRQPTSVVGKLQHPANTPVTRVRGWNPALAVVPDDLDIAEFEGRAAPRDSHDHRAPKSFPPAGVS